MPKALKHILIWAAYFGYVSVTDYITDGFIYDFRVELAFYLSHNILLFYALLYCYRSFKRSSPAAVLFSVLRFCAAVGIFLAVRYVVLNLLMQRLYPADYRPLPPLNWWTLAVLWLNRYAVIALAYFYFTSYRLKQRENERLGQEQQLQVQQKLSLENSLLRAQIDPHFLYNALNALYAKALPLSRELGEAILKLAGIMRYAIKPNPTAKTVPLTEELEHIHNIVDIARFRFNNRIFLNLEIDGDFDGIEVVPLAFITLAENVLKHADLTDAAAPAVIRLRHQDNGDLHFHTWNRKRGSREFPSNGIGLNNTVQRLKDHHGDACRISISDGVDDFSLEVQLLAQVPTLKSAAPDQNRGQVLRS